MARDPEIPQKPRKPQKPKLTPRRKSAQDERRDRLAAELRANLRKRKGQATVRKTDLGPGEKPAD